MRKIALSVLRSVDLDVSFRQSVTDLENGQTYIVRFDNGTHFSGKQRAYIACCSGHHASYKYRIIEKFQSPQHATAWMVAWTTTVPNGYTQKMHEQYEPNEDIVQGLVDNVEDA